MRKNEQLEGGEQKKGLGCKKDQLSQLGFFRIKSNSQRVINPLIQKMGTEVYLVVALEGRN